MPEESPDELPDEGTEQAPEGEQPTQDDGARDRVRHSLLRPSRNQIVVAVLLALVGFAAVTQVRDNQVDNTYSGLREQDLIDVFNGLAGARQRAESERSSLQETRDRLQSTRSRRQAAIDQAEEEAANLRILAGLVPVTGSGVRVTITEEEGEISLGPLLDVIQELRTVGAEAMQINGEVRIVAETAFEDTSGGFLVDGNQVSAPYVIDVIGEPNTLEGAVMFIGGPRNAIQADGGEVQVEKLSSLDIETVREPTQPDHAEAVPSE